MTTWAWREALDSLQRALPGSSGFLLDQLTGIAPEAWRRVRLEGNDETRGEQLLGEVGTVLGNELFVITDASWRLDVGPFLLPAWRLSGLFRAHRERTDESFFAGDVVILSPDEGTLVAVHHAGLVAVARGHHAPRLPRWPLAHLVQSAVFASWDPPLEWTHLVGEIYPDAAVTLPSGRILAVRWFETDPRVSFTAPTGAFDVSFRGPLEELDDAYAEFVAVAQLGEREALRPPPGRGD